MQMQQQWAVHTLHLSPSGTSCDGQVSHIKAPLGMHAGLQDELTSMRIWSQGERRACSCRTGRCCRCG